MTPDQIPPSADSTSSPRQKIVAGIVVVVVIFLIWQIYGMFSGGSTAANAKIAQQAAPPPPPQSVQLVAKPIAMTPREMELAKAQADTQAKYVAALNELQALKLSQQIAEANQAIMTAKLATVTAEKNIVDVVSKATMPVMAGNYVQSLGGEPLQQQPPVEAKPAPLVVTYSVISVSQLQYKWHAVVSYNGNLYSVTIGDVLPADGATVVSINKSGIELEKNGARTKVSLVPII
ncbi:MAG: hypothetical protein WAW86_02830 [Gammaproteobacteria bacterium]